MAYFSLGNSIIAGAGAGMATKPTPCTRYFSAVERPLVNALPETGWDPQKLLEKKALESA